MSFRPDRTANLPPRTCPSSTNHPRHRPPPTPVGGGRRSSLAMRRLTTVRREWSSTRPNETGGPVRRQSFDDSGDGEQLHQGAMRHVVADLAHHSQSVAPAFAATGNKTLVAAASPGRRHGIEQPFTTFEPSDRRAQCPLWVAVSRGRRNTLS